MSNTSKGRGEKGSKFWMQTLVNLDGGKTLEKAIQNEDSSIGKITWLSPCKADNYAELKTEGITGITKSMLSFWPDNGPWWDAVGIDKHGCILLFEAKAHTSETKSHCAAIDPNSILKIKNSMRAAHQSLTNGTLNSLTYNEHVWFNEYYQLGNRLTFLANLRDQLLAQHIAVKLVLLNIVEDPTHISTKEEDWKDHYKEVFNKMFGQDSAPTDVICMYFNVG